MVFNDRRVLKGQTRAQLILARRATLHLKTEYICADNAADQFAQAMEKDNCSHDWFDDTP